MPSHDRELETTWTSPTRCTPDNVIRAGHSKCGMLAAPKELRVEREYHNLLERYQMKPGTYLGTELGTLGSGTTVDSEEH